MNVQDAAALTTPDGSVRNIHNKNGDLLWSAVGYNVRYDGDTTQQTYTGKNMFSVSFVVSGGVPSDIQTNTFILDRENQRYFRCDFPTLLPSGTYTISFDISNNNTLSGVSFNIFNESETSIDGAYNLSGSHYSGTFTFNESVKIIRWFIASNESNDKHATISNVQIEAGSTATTYEQYVGGIPAPNPDYPQDIHVVTGTQTVKITGKNLCSGTEISGNGALVLFYFNGPLSSDTVTISTDLSDSTASNTVALVVDGANKGTVTTFSGSAGEVVSRKIVFTADQMEAINSGTNVYIRLYKSGGHFTNPETPMIEYGSNATSYEPYQGQSYTVNLGSIELCKLGTYQDYIYKSGDGWYVHKDMDKVILDGTGTWSPYNYHPAEYTYMHNVDGARSGYHTSICSHFTNVDGAWQEGVGQPGYYSDHPTLGRKYFVSDKTTVSDFTTWLSNHNVLLRYALETPTDTKITDSTLVAQLDAIHDWLTRYDYYGIVTGDLPIVINRVLLT